MTYVGYGWAFNKEMVVDKNNKIVECTEDELYMFWLKRWSNLFDFYSYKKRCQELGTKIINDNDNE